MAVFSGGGAPAQLPLQGAPLSLPHQALWLQQAPLPKCSGKMSSGSVNLGGYFVLMRAVFSVSP